MGRLETVASLKMASSDCVNCICLPSIRSSDSDVAEGCRYGKIDCGVPVHSAQCTVPSAHNAAAASYEPSSGKVSDSGEVQQEAR